MEKLKQKIEENCFIHLSNLVSIIEKKSSECKKQINNTILSYNLWLSDSNLIMLENIKLNKPTLDVIDNSVHFENSTMISNVSDDMIKDLFIDFFFHIDFLFKNSLTSTNESEIKSNINDHLNQISKTNYNHNDNKSNLDKYLINDINAEFLNEKIKNPLHNILEDIGKKSKNLSKVQNNLIIGQKNKRERDSEDNISSLFSDIKPNKQLKLNSQIIDFVNEKHLILEKDSSQKLYKKENENDFEFYKVNTINFTEETKNKKNNEFIDHMEIENNNNININSSILRESFNNNDQIDNCSNLKTINNFQSNSIKTNVIMEQPSKEQEITLTPQTSNKFSFRETNEKSKIINLSYNQNINLNIDKNEYLNDKTSNLKMNYKKLEETNNYSFNLIEKNDDNCFNKYNNNLLMSTRASNFTFCNNVSINNVFLNSIKDSKNEQNFDKNSTQNNEFKLNVEKKSLELSKNDTKNFNQINNIDLNLQLNKNSIKQIQDVDDKKNDANIKLFNETNNFNSKPNLNIDLSFNEKHDDLINSNEINKIIKLSSETLKKFSISKNYEEDKYNSNIKFKSSNINSIFGEIREKIDKNENKEQNSRKKSEKVNSFSKDLNKNQNIHSNSKNKQGVSNDKKNSNNKENIIHDGLSETKKKEKDLNTSLLKPINEKIMNSNKIENEKQRNFKKCEDLSNFNGKINGNKFINKIEINGNPLSFNNKKKNFATKKFEKIVENFQNGIVNEKINKLGAKEFIINKKNADSKNIPVDQKVKEILKLSSYDESICNNDQTDKEKTTKKTLKNTKIFNYQKTESPDNLMNRDNNEKNQTNLNMNFNKINDLINKSPNILQKLKQNNENFVHNDYDQEEIKNLNVDSNNLNKNILVESENNKIVNLNKELSQSNLKNMENSKLEAIVVNCENFINNKLPSNFSPKICFTENLIDKNYILKIENNKGRDNFMYELTDETPESSDYNDSNDDCLDINSNFLKKKKKLIPQWVQDKNYIKYKIMEQVQNKNLSEEIFGTRKKIEYLDLRNIFTTACSNYDIRGESADWKIDNTMSSRRYNRVSRHDKNTEEIKENMDEHNVFSNFKKTSRNLFNDFNHNNHNPYSLDS